MSPALRYRPLDGWSTSPPELTASAKIEISFSLAGAAGHLVRVAAVALVDVQTGVTAHVNVEELADLRIGDGCQKFDDYAAMFPPRTASEPRLSPPTADKITDLSDQGVLGRGLRRADAHDPERVEFECDQAVWRYPSGHAKCARRESSPGDASISRLRPTTPDEPPSPVLLPRTLDPVISQQLPKGQARALAAVLQ